MSTSFKILLLEDDESDAFLFSRALKEMECSCTVTHFDNPAHAVSMLEQIIDPAKELPHLIVTDMKMPVMSGLDFVKWLRASPYELVPVVMLSSSNMRKDICAAYQVGANSWITKPNNYSALAAALRITVQYWRDVCEAPMDCQIQEPA